MKTFYLVIIFAFASLATIAQELKFEDMSSETRPDGPLKSYKSYVCKDGTVFKVGELIKIGVPSSGYDLFSYIWVGDGLILGDQQLEKAYSNTITKIHRIVVGGTKQTGYKALLRTKAPEGRVLPYIIIAEKAYQTGEIKH
jgi:hypothetical protein